MDPRVLLLDDATSAVDSSTEETIFTGLRRVLAGRTSLIVAHRVSTLHLADRVVLLDGGRVADDGTHEELMARNAAYRELLTGLDADAAASVGDSIETLTELEVTPEAWQSGSRADAVRAADERRASKVPQTASLGPGVRGSGWQLALAPRPSCSPGSRRSRPSATGSSSTSTKESRPDPGFSMRGLVSEFRWPFALGLLLVVLDAVAALLGPWLVHKGIDDGVSAGAAQVLWWASAAFLVVVARRLPRPDRRDLRDRPHQRARHGGLRIRIWAQLQRLSLDYYEREMAGRIMTRMTTDVDQFETLIENGLLAALVSLVTFVGVGVALLLLDVELALWTLLVVIPLVVATVVFRRVTNRLYDAVRESLAVVNADFQESLSGIREAQAFAHEIPTVDRFHAPRAALLRGAAEGTAPDRDVLPVRAVPVRDRRRDRARRRRPPDRAGRADVRRADRVHPLPDDVLLPDPAALAGLRLLAADPGLGQPHLRAHAAGDPDPRARATRRRWARSGATWPWSTCTSATRRREVAPYRGAWPGRLGAPRGRRTPAAAGGDARARPAGRRPRDGGPGRRDRGRASRPCSSCWPASTTPTPAR